jgi:hypothetical protein
MIDMPATNNANTNSIHESQQDKANLGIHPSWLRLIRFCLQLGHGEIEKLKIQDGLPMIAEVTTRKIKFGP